MYLLIYCLNRYQFYHRNDDHTCDELLDVFAYLYILLGTTETKLRLI